VWSPQAPKGFPAVSKCMPDLDQDQDVKLISGTPRFHVAAQVKESKHQRYMLSKGGVGGGAMEVLFESTVRAPAFCRVADTSLQEVER